VEDGVPEPAEVPRQGFDEVVRPHLDYLYALSLRLTGNHADAEDLVQDALLRAFRGFSGLRNHRRPRLWLTRVVTTAFYDRLRDAAREPQAVHGDEEFDLFDTIVEEDPFPYSDRVHLDFLELFDDAKVLEVLQRLHPSHRAALILAHVYGYRAREIAEMTGAPLGTVLAWLHRGRKQLERGLWEYANAHGLLIPPQEARA
jgi:RNA polymerase sigma-70 factor (ECF subfamily)